MLEFFIDNIFVLFGGRVFQQTVDINMGTNCAPLLADFPLFVRSRFHTGTCHEKQQEASPILFNFTLCYIDDDISLNNYKIFLLNNF